MKSITRFITILMFSFTILFLASCASVPATSRDRQLTLSGYTVLETDFGGVERWYAVDKYNYDNFVDEIRFQVGYFKENSIGFVLYGNGTIGESAHFSRDGLNLRWDWGNNYQYSIVMKPDGTGLYYDFSTSTDGTAKPRDIYKLVKF